MISLPDIDMVSVEHTYSKARDSFTAGFCFPAYNALILVLERSIEFYTLWK